MKEKNLKVLAKEAKKRLKNGFWEKYKKDVRLSAERLKAEGVEPSSIIGYYETKASPVKVADARDAFYEKVKKLLDEHGECGNAISMLIDYSEYDSLSYEGKQRYVLRLSDDYRKALERYKREKTLKK